MDTYLNIKCPGNHVTSKTIRIMNTCTHGLLLTTEIKKKQVTLFYIVKVPLKETFQTFECLIMIICVWKQFNSHGKHLTIYRSHRVYLSTLEAVEPRAKYKKKNFL